MMTFKIFPERLVEERHSLGLSQQQMCHILHLPLQEYQAYESGERFPKVESLSKLVYFFDISAEYLLGLTNSKQPLE